LFAKKVFLRYYLIMGKKILIVDADKEFVRSVEEALSNFEVELRVIGGVEAFNMIYGKEKFDLYILSVELPDGNGFSLCRKIKENPVMKNPVILLATSRNAESVRKHQTSAGTKADAYFIKPINPKEFVGYLEEIMRSPLKRKKTEPVLDEVTLNVPEEKPSVETRTPSVREEILLEKELLEREVKALRENIDVLKSRTTSLIRERDEIKEKVEYAEKEKIKLKSLLTEYEKNMNFYKEKVFSMEEKIKEYEESNSLYQKKLKEMEEQISFYKRKGEEAEKKAKELEGELAFYKKKADAAEAKLKEIEKEINRLKEILEEKEKEKKMAFEQMERLKSSISELKAEIDKKELEIEKLRRNFSDISEQIKIKDRKISDLERSVSKLKEEKDTVEKTLGELKKKNEEYEARIIEFQKEIEKKKVIPEEEIKEVEQIEEPTIPVEEKIEEEIEIPVAEPSEDEDITRAIDDFFTETEFGPSKSFETSLDFMIESAREDLASLTTSQEKIAQKIVKLVDIYNLIFRYIFDKIRMHLPNADPQKIFNDYFTDLSEEATAIFKGIKFNEKGELDSFEISRNVIKFVNDMSIPKSEMDATAVSIVSNAMSDLINFMRFISANHIPDADTEDIKGKIELLISKVKTIERT
jgi:DNA-binding response OmpR family regulator